MSTTITIVTSRPQVSVAEERHRCLKEALEVDIASIGGQADKIKVCATASNGLPARPQGHVHGSLP